MTDGWIKLNRSICDSAVFADAEVLQLWIWLLCNAAYEECDVLHCGTVVHLNAGELITGRKKLAQELRTAESKVYRALNLLQQLGNVNIKANNKFSIVTIVNWAKFQQKNKSVNSKTTAKQQQDDSKTTAKQQQNNTNKEIKEIKEYKEVVEVYNTHAHTRAREETTTPPTLEEVRNFCFERQSIVDPARFYNYYSKQGWNIGDWKLKVEEWENNKFSTSDRERAEKLANYRSFESSDRSNIELNDFFENARG